MATSLLDGGCRPLGLLDRGGLIAPVPAEEVAEPQLAHRRVRAGLRLGFAAGDHDRFLQHLVRHVAVDDEPLGLVGCAELGGGLRELVDRVAVEVADRH